MIDLEKQLAGIRLRAWLLPLNFLANAMAIYGLAMTIPSGEPSVWLIMGTVLSIGCIILLSQPNRTE